MILHFFAFIQINVTLFQVEVRFILFTLALVQKYIQQDWTKDKMSKTQDKHGKMLAKSKKNLLYFIK